MKIKATLAALGLLGSTLVLAGSTTTNAVAVQAAPASPQICGNITGAPETAPAGAVTVPAGNNSAVNFRQAGATYWFAPGTHTLGAGQFSQIQPAAGSTFVGAPGAVLSGQGLNAYAFTQHASNVTIKYLTITGFEAPNNEGVVNHDSASGWTIEHNTVIDNGGAALMLGSNNTIRGNCLKDNGQYGFNAYHPAGPVNIVLDHNEITGNNTDDWESRIDGCGCTGGGKFWASRNVTVTNNWVHGNKSVGIWADQNNVNFRIENNWIEDNDSYGLFYETSYNAVVKNNVFKRNAIVDGQARQRSNDNFPVGAIYISEAGYDSRVPGDMTAFEISDNQFTDNWGGVILWENADRFCASPANTSTGDCTLVNPNIGLAQCGQSTWGATGANKPEPNYSDCRWKTQNVKVHDNQFSLTTANLGNCNPNFCGQTGVLSNYGTYPAWSPYKGTVIQQAITLRQGNQWFRNAYVGPWRYVVLEPGNYVTWDQWRAAPYNQDGDGVVTPPPPPPPTVTVPPVTALAGKAVFHGVDLKWAYSGPPLGGFDLLITDLRTKAQKRVLLPAKSRAYHYAASVAHKFQFYIKPFQGGWSSTNKRYGPGRSVSVVPIF